MGTDELIQQLIGLIRKESAVINLYDLVLDAVVDFELKDKLFFFRMTTRDIWRLFWIY